MTVSRNKRVLKLRRLFKKWCKLMEKKKYFLRSESLTFCVDNK